MVRIMPSPKPCHCSTARLTVATVMNAAESTLQAAITRARSLSGDHS